MLDRLQHRPLLISLLVVFAVGCTGSASTSTETAVPTTLDRVDTTSPVAAEDFVRVDYGAERSQFGMLWTPDDADGQPQPVVVLLHGGFWSSRFGLEYAEPLAVDLAQRGYAVWNLEYRRVGEPGGGYPGTFEDVAAGLDHLAVLAADHPIDLDRVVVVGHSAGGHLALWANGRSELSEGDPGFNPVVTSALTIGQAAVTDLVRGDEERLGGGAVTGLLGGSNADVPDRYRVAQPVLTRGRIALVHGDADTIVPVSYSSGAGGESDVVTVHVEPGSDHFDLIDPETPSWARVVEIIESHLDV